MTRSVPVGEVRPLGDRAFLIGVADAAAGRALARALAGAAGRHGRRRGGVRLRRPSWCRCRRPRRGARGRCVALTEAGRVPTPHPAARPRTSGEPGRLVTIPCPSTGPTSTRWPRWPVRRPTRWSALLTAQAADRRRGGVLARVRLPRRASRPAARACRGAPRRARSSRRARWRSPTVTPPSTRPRRRADGSWSAAPAFPSSRRERPPYAVLAPGDRVRFTVAGPGDPLEPAPVRPPPWSAPPEARPRVRGRGAGSAGRRAGRRPAGRRRGRVSRAPVRPIRCRSRWPTGWSATPTGAGALELTGGGTRLRCLGRVPRRRRGRRTRGPRRRHAGAGGPAAAAGRGSGARGRAAQRGGCRTYLSVAGGFLGPECVREQRQRRADGARRRTARPGARAARRPVGTAARGPRRGRLRHRARRRWRRRSELRVVPGPHPEQFEPDALARLAEAVFVVAPDSQPGRAPAAGREGRAPSLRSAGTRERRARLPGRRDRSGAGATGRRPRRAPARPRDARRLSGAGGRGVGRPRPASASARRAPLCASCPSTLAAADERRGRRAAPRPSSGRWSGTTRWRSTDRGRDGESDEQLHRRADADDDDHDPQRGRREGEGQAGADVAADEAAERPAAPPPPRPARRG